MAKKALGKGLNALFGDDAPATSSTVADGAQVAASMAAKKDGVVYLKLADVLQNPLQPRRTFDEAKLKELADSIKIHGVVQPVVVAKVPEGYRLIVGERRCRASRLAGLDEVPAIVREYADQQMLEVALIENLQREDLNPIEEAQAYQYLLKQHGLTHDKLAERLGCSRPAITNTIRLLELPDEIRQDLVSGIIKPGHARAILSLSDEKLRYKAWMIIKEESLSVRKAEELVAKLAESGTAKQAVPNMRPTLSADWQDIVQQLRDKLNADVRITPKSKGRGRVEIHYHDQDELESIVDMLFYRSSNR